MKVRVITAPVGSDSGYKTLEGELNLFLREEDHPLIEQVTHVVHANKHWVTIWYVGGK